MGLPLSAFILIKLFDLYHKNSYLLIRLLNYSVIGLFILVLTLSGIIDFFPIYNDPKGEIRDIPANEAATWINNHTDPKTVILNTNYLYNPASLAGRKIFLGWPYFSWSAGYNTDMRFAIMKNVFESDTIQKTCRLLQPYSIRYILFETNTIEEISFNEERFASWFTRIWQSSSKDYRIYDTNDSCRT